MNGITHQALTLNSGTSEAKHHADQAAVGRERYGQLVDQPWQTPWESPLSTFSVDVDTASYANIRRLLRSGGVVPKDAVRTEECINYFDYAYPVPTEGGPFAVHVELASCPWKAAHHLVKIGLKGREVDSNTRPASNLVFLIDVSGSMNRPNKLPLLVESMKVLVEELDERDTVGIVVYAGSAGTILEPTKVVGNGRTEILSALDHLRAGGSTAGAAGIRGAYDLAVKHHQKGGVNRVILATDGDFNVGTSSTGELVDLVKENAQSGVSLSVLGFGSGNINDAMLEAITNDGNGNYHYIDTQREGRKVFLQNLSGTLVTIAKDVKIQVEFNPGKVAAYRLIGYANRILPPEAFNDDTVDAGDIGAGHTVTALYEIVPVGEEIPRGGGSGRVEVPEAGGAGGGGERGVDDGEAALQGAGGGEEPVAGTAGEERSGAVEGGVVRLPDGGGGGVVRREASGVGEDRRCGVGAGGRARAAGSEGGPSRPPGGVPRAGAAGGTTTAAGEAGSGGTTSSDPGGGGPGGAVGVAGLVRARGIRALPAATGRPVRAPGPQVGRRIGAGDLNAFRAPGF